MAGYNGVGQFSFSYSWTNDAANGIPITASRMDGQFNDAINGFDLVICRDGQSTTSASIPFAQGATFGGASSFSNVGALGLGTLTPTNLLDGVQNVNSPAVYQLVNQNTGTGAQARSVWANSVNSLTLGITGTGFTPAGMILADCSYLRGSGAGGVAIFATNATAPVTVGANSSEIARFIPNRGFVVGTTSAYGGDASDFAYNGSTSNGLGINDVSSVSSSGFLIFRSSGTAIGSVTNNGNTGVLYNVSSDERLKNKLEIQRDHINMIRNIWVGDVEYKSNRGKPVLAVMAQQANAYYPDFITQPNEIEGEGEQYWQADYSKLAPLSLKGVQALLELVDALTARVVALEARGV